jgi:hypothetical protein
MTCAKQFQRIRTNPIARPRGDQTQVSKLELAGTVVSNLLCCLFMEIHADLLTARGDIQ